MGYLCANFSLSLVCSRLRPDERDRQTSDAHHRLMPPLWGRGITMSEQLAFRGFKRIGLTTFACMVVAQSQCSQTRVGLPSNLNCHHRTTHTFLCVSDNSIVRRCVAVVCCVRTSRQRLFAASGDRGLYTVRSLYTRSTCMHTVQTL